MYSENVIVFVENGLPGKLYYLPFFKSLLPIFPIALFFFFGLLCYSFFYILFFSKLGITLSISPFAYSWLILHLPISTKKSAVTLYALFMYNYCYDG